VRKLERIGAPCLDVPFATADDALARADLVRLAISRSACEYGIDAFDHVVSIGDAPWDLRAARALDLPFVAVGSRCGGADAGTLSDYEDGPEVMKKLTNAVCW
jgi:phosphoglycolate phosphatase-like HAD superfamily hydrolase